MIDIHSHLDDEKIIKNLDEVIKRAIDEGVKYIVTAGVNINSSIKAIEISKKYNIVFGVIGIHPSEARHYDYQNLPELESLIKEEKILGIGEIGLDYTYKTDKNLQIKIFEKQLEIASKFNLPVVLHIRNTFNDIFEIVKNFNLNLIWHSFTGTIKEAEKFLEIGGYISFSGIITFKNAENLREVVKIIPNDKIFLETDSPYLTPEPIRGKINEPSYIKYIYKKVSEIKNLELEELIKMIEENFKKIFNV